MKATLWLWTAVMALLCVSLQVSALPYSDSRVVQENSLLSLKRTKPSLSIVNPLDVLRQRIILEMARRQMRENTRQVELNKALLREIGKRSSNLYDGSEYPPDYTYYDRKLYNQHVQPMPDRGSPAEDELEAVVESLLRNQGLTARDGNYAGKLQRTRFINGRPMPAAAAAAASLRGMASNPMAQHDQPQQLSSLFSNEEEREDLKTKDQALRQSLSVGQDLDQTNGGNGEEDEDQDGHQAARVGGTGTGVLKPMQDADNLLEQPNQPSVSSLSSSASSDRNSGTEFGPRYVYGMYKNRYAN
uniref:Corticotropin-releasing factor domain-containing protein n=1 Tax=Anopheles merus TaxID=30066 RepID=A0A182V3P5_ANOME